MLMDDVSKYKFDLGSADDPGDLELARVAQLFHNARMAVKALNRELAAGGTLPPADAADLRSQTQESLAACEDGHKNLEHAFLAHEKFLRAQEAKRVSQATRVTHIRDRLIYMGTDEVPDTWSLLGWLNDKQDFPLALPRDHGHLILASGLPGSGKTLMSTIIGEGGLLGGEPISSNFLFPTAYVFIHIEEHNRLPALLSGLRPNPTLVDLEILKRCLGVDPAAFRRIRLAIPHFLMEELMPRLQPYIDLGLEVVELRVHLTELGQPGLEAFLGADKDARFIQRMLEDAQNQGSKLNIEGMRHFIDTAKDLNQTMKEAAYARLPNLTNIAAKKPTDPGIWDMFEPGVGTVVYLGGPTMGHARMTPILVGLFHGLMMESTRHGAFQRVVAVDEVNLLAGDPLVWNAFLRMGRLVRHRGTTLILMGQDLMCVPDEMFGLAGLTFNFQQRSQVVWDYARTRIGPARGLTYGKMAELKTAQAQVGVTVSTAPWWQHGTQMVRLRPPLTMHGGFTRGMV